MPERGKIGHFPRRLGQQEVYRRRLQGGEHEKKFGLSCATTLLHFISGGPLPFDSRVRRAMTRLLSSTVPNTVRWYLDSYVPLFSAVAVLCGKEDLRRDSCALFNALCDS